MSNFSFNDDERSESSLIPKVNGTNETNIIPPQDLRPHTPVVRNQQSFVSSIIANNCDSMIMILACVPDIHNNWITLINLAANGLIAKTHTFEVPYTCFCGGDKAILANDLIKNAANEPRVCPLLARIAILAGDLLNCGINLWHKLSMRKIEVSHRSKRSQSAIIIFTIVILVKTTKILELVSYQAITLLYDLLLQMVRVGNSEIPASCAQDKRSASELHPDKARRQNRTSEIQCKVTRAYARFCNLHQMSRTPWFVDSNHSAPSWLLPFTKILCYPDFAALILHYYFISISFVDGNTV